jgi:hypothetical protein
MRRLVLLLYLVLGIGVGVWIATRVFGHKEDRPPVVAEEPAPGTAARDPHDLLDPVERDWLVRAGLKDPASALRSDLVGHPELIAGEGIVGGTMAFRRDQIWVLPGGHVWALADDGHIELMMLLAYRVSRDGKITWSAVYHHAP